MSILEILAQPDSELKVLHMELVDKATVGGDKVERPSTNTWLFLTGVMFHDNTENTSLYFRDKDNNTIFAFIKLKADASGFYTIEPVGTPLLDVTDKILLTTATQPSGCYVNLKFLEFVPKSIRSTDTRRGFWRWVLP